jgi:hypothetical protein
MFSHVPSRTCSRSSVTPGGLPGGGSPVRGAAANIPERSRTFQSARAQNAWNGWHAAGS